jgi:hypothetical protein
MITPQLVTINAIANCTTAVSALGLLIHIFGDPSNEIWDNRIKAWLAKIGLSVTTCGAVSNAITLSDPPPTEIILNCGIAITLFWLSWWQWELFKEMQSKLKQMENKPAPKRHRKRKPKAKLKPVTYDT